MTTMTGLLILHVHTVVRDFGVNAWSIKVLLNRSGLRLRIISAKKPTLRRKKRFRRWAIALESRPASGHLKQSDPGKSRQ
ncbi:hypothetical protein [Aristaeella lactis]|uniref:hypothetical protein n=1 Tax=Aristaeella lactis TaxID=3046383 RepID=UPI001BB5849F|nr:hypothetical protein [Aristaeella lactis]QUA54675.1 hypothetical protein JYE50_15605 [Aristaeella lactis]